MHTLWEITCGLGLCLAGQRLAVDGATIAFGRAHARWLGAGNPHGLRAGLALAAVAPGHGRAARAGLGLASVLAPEEALWAALGTVCGGALLLALAAATVLLGPLVQGLGMLLLLVGAAAWSAVPVARYAAAGKLACGWGALLAGLGLLHSGFSTVAGRVAFDSFGFGAAGLMAGGIVLGCATTALVRSSAPIMLLAAFAAAGQTIELATAAALVLGAHVGTGIEAVLATRDGTPATRRMALAQQGFLLLGFVVGLLLLGVLAFLGSLPGPAVATIALFVFHALFLAIVFAPLCWHAPLAPFVLGLLERRFRDDEQDETRPRHLDVTTLDLPDLALCGLASELERVAEHALGFATIVLGEERATSFRTRLSLGVVERLGAAVEEHVAQLTRAELPEHVAQVLPDVPQATHAYRQLIEWTNMVQMAPLEIDPRLRREIVGLQHEVAGLLGQSDPRRLGCSLEDATALLQRIETHVRELERVLYIGAVPAEAAHACAERLHAVGRIGMLAVEAGHGLAGVFALCPSARGTRRPQIDEPEPEQPQPPQPEPQQQPQQRSKASYADGSFENVA